MRCWSPSSRAIFQDPYWPPCPCPSTLPTANGRSSRAAPAPSERHRLSRTGTRAAWPSAFTGLLLPDGRWIDLEFSGLNQVGEGALKDQVNRHYLSMFAAVGAVGVLSGLTLAGAPPYGLQTGVGQGLGQGAIAILDRFLNRLPTITIRAGHRLRIWFTSDVLVPRAGTRQ